MIQWKIFLILIYYHLTIWNICKGLVEIARRNLIFKGISSITTSGFFSGITSINASFSTAIYLGIFLWLQNTFHIVRSQFLNWFILEVSFLKIHASFQKPLERVLWNFASFPERLAVNGFFVTAKLDVKHSFLLFDFSVVLSLDSFFFLLLCSLLDKFSQLLKLNSIII